MQIILYLIGAGLIVAAWFVAGRRKRPLHIHVNRVGMKDTRPHIFMEPFWRPGDFSTSPPRLARMDISAYRADGQLLKQARAHWDDGREAWTLYCPACDRLYALAGDVWACPGCGQLGDSPATAPGYSPQTEAR